MKISSKLPGNLALRVIALIAAVPAIYLRAINSAEPGMMVMTLVFYGGGYLLLAATPPRWAAFQVGFSVGYSLSMEAALVLVVLAQVGFSNMPPSDLLYSRVALCLNPTLTVTGVGTWIWNRRKFNNVLSLSFLFVGIIYPIVSFLVEMLIGGTLYH